MHYTRKRVGMSKWTFFALGLVTAVLLGAACVSIMVLAYEPVPPTPVKYEPIPDLTPDWIVWA